MVYYTGQLLENVIQSTSHTQHRPLISKKRKSSKTERLAYPALSLLKTVRTSLNLL